MVVKKGKRRIFLALALVLLFNSLISSLEQARFSENVKFRESAGVLFAQIGAVLNDPEADIDEAEIEELNKILPTNIWKENYRPSFADTIKFDSKFDNEYLNKNKTKFVKMWFQIMVKNFPIYVKAYISHSYGYWGVIRYNVDETQSCFTSINNNTGEDTVWGIFCTENGLKNRRVLPEQLNENLKNLFIQAMQCNFLITPGVMIFVIFLCAAMLVRKNIWKGLIPCIPVVLTWGTMMAASPASMIYRYSYYLLVCLPVIVVLCVKDYNAKSVSTPAMTTIPGGMK